MITGAIFDMDGVLLDSMGIWDSVGKQFLIRHGKKPEPDLAQVLFTMHMQESAEYMRVKYDLPGTSREILQQIVDLVEEYYAHVILPKEGAGEFLQRLKERGVSVTVATANDRRLALAGLEGGGLLPYIDEIFTCGEVGQGKESPGVYQAAWKSMGTELAHTWVFEDSLHGILTAQKAGFPTVGIYDKSSKQHLSDIKQNCTYYLGDFRRQESFFQKVHQSDM